MSRQAVVLAGGLAQRMLPDTEIVPKFLLSVAGRPFGLWLLERLRAHGYDEVVLCTGHLGEPIEAAIGDGRTLGLRVIHSNEGAVRLGTAGALRHALEWLAPTFLVTYGDAFLPFDYRAPLADLEVHADHALGTMAVYKNEGRFDASNTAISGERVARYEKGVADAALDHIDYGAMALKREVIEALAAGSVACLSTLQHELAAAGELRAFVATERFYEIGSKAGRASLDAALRSGAIRP
jgi:NDP-sugar pyrophosphorylase family protein